MALKAALLKDWQSSQVLNAFPKGVPPFSSFICDYGLQILQLIDDGFF